VIGGQPADVWTRDGDGSWVPNESLRALPSRKDWSFVVPPHEAHVLAFSRDPADSAGWLAAIEQGGIVRSTDDGRTWAQSSPNWDAHVVVHSGPGAAVAAAGEGLFASRDGGATWVRAAEPSGYSTGLTRDAGGAIYAATRETGFPVWISRDGGFSWSRWESAAGVEEPGHGVHALAADPRCPGIVFHGAGRTIWLLGDGPARVIASDLPIVRRLVVVAGD
jgi:photosystem II stability/assembly factor-like uncharacterized protein